MLSLSPMDENAGLDNAPAVVVIHQDAEMDSIVPLQVLGQDSKEAWTDPEDANDGGEEKRRLALAKLPSGHPKHPQYIDYLHRVTQRAEHVVRVLNAAGHTENVPVFEGPPKEQHGTEITEDIKTIKTSFVSLRFIPDSVEQVFRKDEKYKVFQSRNFVLVIIFIMSFFQIGNALLSTWNGRDLPLQVYRWFLGLFCVAAFLLWWKDATAELLMMNYDNWLALVLVVTGVGKTTVIDENGSLGMGVYLFFIFVAFRGKFLIAVIVSLIDVFVFNLYQIGVRSMELLTWSELLEIDTLHLCLLFLLARVIYRYEYAVRKAWLLENDFIIQEAHTKEVLDNIFPSHINSLMEERQSTGSRDIIWMEEPSVSVLFCDLVTFTQISANLSPTFLVATLDSVYSVFDEMVDEMGCQKMETVAKTYMVACGLPGTRRKHVFACVALAQEMIKTMLGVKLPVRCGVHTGKAIAGVVGVTRPQFSLFGDTVNTASRMQSTGVENKIALSPQAYDKLQAEGLSDCWHYTEREVSPKGKGKILTRIVGDVKNADLLYREIFNTGTDELVMVGAFQLVKSNIKKAGTMSPDKRMSETLSTKQRHDRMRLSLSIDSKQNGQPSSKRGGNFKISSTPRSHASGQRRFSDTQPSLPALAETSEVKRGTQEASLERDRADTEVEEAQERQESEADKEFASRRHKYGLMHFFLLEFLRTPPDRLAEQHNQESVGDIFFKNGGSVLEESFTRYRLGKTRMQSFYTPALAALLFYSVEIGLAHWESFEDANVSAGTSDSDWVFGWYAPILVACFVVLLLGSSWTSNFVSDKFMRYTQVGFFTYCLVATLAVPLYLEGVDRHVALAYLLAISLCASLGLHHHIFLKFFVVAAVGWCVAALGLTGVSFFEFLTLSAYLGAGAVITAVASYGREMYDRDGYVLVHQIAHEKEQADAFLYHMLPRSIADRLKFGEKALAQQYSNITILYSDIKGFTTYSASTTPDKVIKLLSALFVLFDNLTIKHGVYKVQTIGDAYVLVAGLPFVTHAVNTMHREMQKTTKATQSPSKACLNCILMALDMLHEVFMIRDEDERSIQMRIGLHTGSIVAGVIGNKKLRFDMWGSDPIVANYLEALSEPMGICISETTRYQLEVAAGHKVESKNFHKLHTETEAEARDRLESQETAARLFHRLEDYEDYHHEGKMFTKTWLLRYRAQDNKLQAAVDAKGNPLDNAKSGGDSGPTEGFGRLVTESHDVNHETLGTEQAHYDAAVMRRARKRREEWAATHKGPLSCCSRPAKLPLYADTHRTVYAGKLQSSNLSSFPSNAIKNTKYTFFNFLPKNFMEQFSLHINRYFLFIALLQLITVITPVNPITTWGPLAVIFGISAIKELVEDRGRAEQDKLANATKFDVVRKGDLVSLASSEIRVGDIVRLKENEQVPCDLLLLKSATANGGAYVQTTNLDGETDLKPRSAIEATAGMSDEEIHNLTCVLQCPPPNDKIYQFDCRIWLAAASNPLVGVSLPNLKLSYALSVTSDQLLQQTTKIRNAGWVYGMAVYTGNETKFGNSKADTFYKYSKTDSFINTLAVYIFVFQLTLTLVFGTIGEGFRVMVGKREWYLDYPVSDEWYEWIIIPARFLLLNSTMIPISLKISLDLCKLAYSYFINHDMEMSHVDSDSGEATFAHCNNTSIAETLGTAKYLLCDKTGTLTQNHMEFKQMSAGGRQYFSTDLREGGGLHRLLQTESSPNGLMDQKTKQNGNNEEEGEDDGMELLELPLEEQDDQDDSVSSTAALDMLIHFALNNTVYVEDSATLEAGGSGEKHAGGAAAYKSASPDELALVNAAASAGVVLKSRDSDRVVLDVLGKTREFEVLRTLEFTSERRRMSVVVREVGTTEILVLTKGADSALLPLLAMVDADGAQLYTFVEKTVNHVNQFGDLGLRTLAFARKTISNEEWENFSNLCSQANKDISARIDKVHAVYALLEQGLFLEGASAIEDKLQDGVRKCILSLRLAGMKIWMVTGDKFSTAVQIARGCCISSRGATHLLLEGDTADDVGQNLMQHLTQVHKVRTAVEHVLIVEGEQLGIAAERHRAALCKLMCVCSAVVICRVTPAQKAIAVRMLKDSGTTVVAIGDGGNDVAMIQEADVGIGIRGKEGMQAARAADFQVSYFRDVQKLLLVHGRQSYMRTALVAQYSFYKSFLFCTIQIIYGFFSQFSGVSLFNSMSITAYNAVLFFPIVSFVLDQDIAWRHLMQFPRLYKDVQEGKYFNLVTMGGWFVRAVWQSAVLFFVVIFSLTAHEDGTDVGSEYETVGHVVFQSYLFVQSVTMLMELRFITWVNVFVIALIHGLAVLVLWSTSRSMFFTTGWDLNGYYAMANVFATPRNWINILITTMACILPVYAKKCISQSYFPDMRDHHRFFSQSKLAAKQTANV